MVVKHGPNCIPPESVLNTSTPEISISLTSLQVWLRAQLSLDTMLNLRMNSLSLKRLMEEVPGVRFMKRTRHILSKPCRQWNSSMKPMAL